MKNFIISDNQELTRLGMEAILSGFEGTVAEAGDKASLLKLLSSDSDVLVIIDYTLFDFRDEDELLSTVAAFPASVWLLISDDLNHATIKKFLYSSKRISVVFKDTPEYIIREAIKVTLSGSRYICQHAAEMLVDDYHENEPSGVSALTSTEISVLKSIAQGKTTKEIALERCSSVHTINTHRKNIFRKLEVNTAHEAVKKAFISGIISPSEFYV